MTRRTFLWLMLGSFCISALLGVLAALAQSSETAQVLGGSVVINLTLVAMFLSMLLRDLGNSSLRWLLMVALILSVPAGLLWVTLIFTAGLGSGVEEVMARTGGGLTFFVLWCLYSGYCFCFSIRETWFRALVWFLFASGTGFLLLLELLVIDERLVEGFVRLVFVDDDVFFRLLVAQIVLFSAGSLALPVIHLIRKVLHGGDVALAERVMVTLDCPRCELRQELPVGGAWCARCRLEIRINVEEPRCNCGFLLYRFTGDACPECGRPVSDHLRWTPLPE